MYDQNSTQLINDMLLALNGGPDAPEMIIHASEFDHMLDKLQAHGASDAVAGSFISRWLDSLEQRKQLFDYLRALGYQVIDDPVLPFTRYAIEGLSVNRFGASGHASAAARETA